MFHPTPTLRRTALWAAAAAGLGLVATALGAEAPRTWLLDAARGAGTHLGGRTALPNWSVYLLSACAAACAWQARRWGRPVLQRRAPAPRPADYQHDRFLGVRWAWHWDEHQRPKGLWAACPGCATRLVTYVAKPPADRRVKMFCEHCRVTLVDEPGDRDYLHARIARQIERKLRTGEWLDCAQDEAAEPTRPGDSRRLTEHLPERLPERRAA